MTHIFTGCGFCFFRTNLWAHTASCLAFLVAEAGGSLVTSERVLSEVLGRRKGEGKRYLRGCLGCSPTRNSEKRQQARPDEGPRQEPSFQNSRQGCRLRTETRLKKNPHPVKDVGHRKPARSLFFYFACPCSWPCGAGFGSRVADPPKRLRKRPIHKRNLSTYP
jgi:hypothetical protein